MGSAGLRAVLALGLAAPAAIVAGGCSDPCCTYESRPIALLRADQGELLALIQADDGSAGKAVLDTGTPVTVLGNSAGQATAVERHDLRLLASGPGGIGGRVGGGPTRALLRGVTMVRSPLTPIEDGGGGRTMTPVALLGGDLLTAFSVEIGFAAPELVLWANQPASDGFLAESGYAVLRVTRRGASETEVHAPGGIGPGGPYQFPPSLLALRACAAPAVFDREAAPPASCCPGDERTLASGVDLSLLLGTGYGPLILSRSAWNRITRTLPAAPATTARPLLVASAEAAILNAEWSTLPRLALVDREADTTLNPGPCVELGRARRLEQVDVAQSRNAEHAVCALPCDADPGSLDRAQNSAAYLELGGELPVAIVDDGEPLLGARSAQIFPDGPQIDGILGAAALHDARLEIDYQAQPARAILSCEAGVDATRCRAVGRCPRLPSKGQQHVCFGLPAHALPGMCDNPPAACP